MNGALAHIWTPLSSGSLLWLALTIVAFLAGRAIQKACHASPFANPVLIAILVVGSALAMSGTPYSVYFSGAQFIHLLLGPATIALAIPLARNFSLVKNNIKSLGLALMAGSATSIASGIGIVWLLGGSRAIAFSVAPKAATTPIAMAVSQQNGGLPALTAGLAILGGILAAIAGQRVLHGFKIRNWRAQGLAAGVAGSGIATAHVAAQNELGAAFAAIGVGMNGLLTALLVPLFSALWR